MSTQIEELLKDLKLKYAVSAYQSLQDDQKLLASITLDDALLSLLTAEIDGRSKQRQIMLLRMSKIPVLSELSDIAYDENRGQKFSKLMARLRTLSWIETGHNVCILGSSGSGKTFISSAIAREATRKGYSVLFSNARDLAARFTELRAQGSRVYAQARKRLQNQRLLVLDDFCLTPPSVEDTQSLFDIMNDRSGKHSTLVTSQKDAKRWVEEMGISAVGEAVAERIEANSITMVLGSGSRRRKADEQ